jgi:hypothetical protein
MGTPIAIAAEYCTHDAPISWQVSSSNWEKGMGCFYYPTDKQKVLHHLELENYGVDGHWVILQRA